MLIENIIPILKWDGTKEFTILEFASERKRMMRRIIEPIVSTDSNENDVHFRFAVTPE
jgi:hypothetical protein